VVRSGVRSSIILIVLLAAMVAASRAAADCTGCHVTLEEDPSAAHSYRDWETSKHAAYGVSCVNCHGGDSEARVAQEAHIHVEFAGDAEAMDVARQRLLVQGCGNCHHTERENFQRSPHQRALVSGQAAADCTTCHGVLGTQFLHPLNIRASCTGCHSGGSAGVEVGIAQTLMEYLHRVRNAVSRPEPGQSLDPARRQEVEATIATALNALHALNLGAVGLTPLEEPPHCTACHIRLQQDPAWGHSYEDWEESIHASFDISCVNCHGGDSEAEVAEEAHMGMGLTGARDPDSNDQRLLLAEGCGNCHPNERAGFRASPHYRALLAGDRAADCTTCHGAVGGQVLTPETIASTCRQCHTTEAPGTTVGVAQTLLEYTRRVRMAMVFPEPGHLLTGVEREQVEEAISAAMAAWHEFDLVAVGLALAHGTGAIER
jgi:hypothetical protein